MPEQCRTKEGEARSRLFEMLRQGLQADFEAALHLKMWDELDTIVEVSRLVFLDP